MVLIYPGRLPPGALVRPDPVALSPVLPPPEAIWLQAGTGQSLTEAGRLSLWQAREGLGAQVLARPVPANATGTAVRAGALVFATGENGGLRLAPLMDMTPPLTLGLILTPEGEARSLFTLQPAHGDYVFVALEEGGLRLAQRGAEDALTLPCPEATGPMLILCSFDRGMARLSLNGEAPLSAALPLPRGPAELFLACRGARAGLRNKLGAFALHDLLIWPGKDLLAGPASELAGALALWAARRRHGL